MTILKIRGMWVERRYRFDLHADNSFWTIVGTIHGFTATSVLIRDYRGIVTIQRDDIERTMGIAGDGITVPLDAIIHHEPTTD